MSSGVSLFASGVPVRVFVFEDGEEMQRKRGPFERSSLGRKAVNHRALRGSLKGCMQHSL